MKMLIVSVLCLTLISTFAEGKALQKRTNPAGRIIGGQPAFVGQFPSVAAIYINNNDATYFCAGALIAHQWVLTAGHCAESGVVFQIYLGSNSLSSADPNRITLATSTYYIHPEYNATSLQNDVGLLRLHLSVTFTEYVQPATLPTSAIANGQRTIAVGWGQTSDTVAGLVDQLRYVAVTTIPNVECQLSYAYIIYDTMVCVAGNFNEGTCRGDSGGPLFVDGPGPQVLAGISSFISTHGCESSDPSGYSRTFPTAQWIKNITELQ